MARVSTSGVDRRLRRTYAWGTSLSIQAQRSLQGDRNLRHHRAVSDDLVYLALLNRSQVVRHDDRFQERTC